MYFQFSSYFPGYFDGRYWLWWVFLVLGEFAALLYFSCFMQALNDSLYFAVIYRLHLGHLFICRSYQSPDVRYSNLIGQKAVSIFTSSNGRNTEALTTFFYVFQGFCSFSEASSTTPRSANLPTLYRPSRAPESSSSIKASRFEASVRVGVLFPT